MANTDQNPKSEYSLKPNADLIIGQEFLLSVKVTMPEKFEIPDEMYILINKGFNNIKIVGSHIIESDGSYKFYVNRDLDNKRIGWADIKLAVVPGIQYGAPVTFEISSNLPKFQGQKFECKAKDINTGTLNLHVVNQYLEAPFPNSTNYSKTKIYTKILDKKNGAPLINTPVFITSMDSNSLEEFDVYDATDSYLLLSHKINNMEGIVVSSDGAGNVVFYIHAKNSVTARVSLLSMIIGVSQGFSPPIYSVYSGAVDDSDIVKLPTITGYNPPGYLVPQSEDDKDFIVKINQYDNPFRGDAVLFFYAKNGEHKKFTGYTRFIKSTQPSASGEYQFSLPYQMFPYNIPLNFSYVIIRESGDTLTSMDLPLTYAGGVPYEPKDDINRLYQPCIVYSSYGVEKNNAIVEHVEISYADIRQYPNSDGTGLYIQILGTDNPTVDKDKVPVGSSVTLNSYINSGNINGVTPYPPVVVEKQNNNEIYAVVKIPYKDIVNILPIDGDTQANIRFEYYIQDNSSDDNAFLYSQVWISTIGTIP
ncbi:hypothetical protein ID850_12630 [Xenorhabdus sp. Flor]|uniref:hypothetical protein n=1 Tax=Xenorhabdus cabanillasii TaxID=351673 RepID=UPI0019CCBDDF|nr:hypothetical protein [Xenorhabdus sp. Flor]MBD2815598.1 hypothetical protein [Xenorhabdus sp. Flor]